MSTPTAHGPSARDAEVVRVADQMHRLVTSAVLLREAVARSAGLNPTDLQAVEVLLRDGPATPGELADRVGVTAGGAVTALIDRLQKAGWVTRRRHPQDRRKVRVVARTEVALERIGPVPERVAARWAEYLGTLTQDELAFAHELLAEAAGLNREAAAELNDAAAAGSRGVSPSAAGSSSPPPGGAPPSPDGAGGGRGGRPPNPR